MLLQLLKDVPLMFVIAAIIWLAVIFIIVKFIRNKKASSKKITVITAAILLAVILTVIDIWLFVFFIPTHFKKSNQQQTANIAATDIVKEIQSPDSNNISAKTFIGIDSSKNEKSKTIELKTKIFTTNQASVTFLSQGEDEDIEATNHQSAIAINGITGDIKVIALIKGFQFENQIMQNHFNEPDYMNSAAFPKSEFKGKIINLQEINFTKNGGYHANVTGALSIHGITKNIIINATITIADNKVSVQSIFKIKRMNYGITTNEIADELQIIVKGTLQ